MLTIFVFLKMENVKKHFGNENDFKYWYIVDTF